MSVTHNNRQSVRPSHVVLCEVFLLRLLTVQADSRSWYM